MDREGSPLAAGDHVIYERPDRPEIDGAAVVLAVTEGGKYLIQLDPIGPRSPFEHPIRKRGLDHEESLRPHLAGNPDDPQEAFEVEGSTLTLLQPEELDEDEE